MRKILFCLLIFSFYITNAQFVAGEILVQLNHETSINQIIQVIQNQGFQIELKKQLSKHNGIYLLKTSNEDALSELQNRIGAISGIIFVQKNHFLKKRGNPNDSFFNNQWQYLNTGQNGGLLGADIDAPEAWNITTGGITAFFDTIVVAVIDDGVDYLHEDLFQNMWFNHHEIPGDSIDNDGNGYIDDYKGWNAYTGNDDLSDNGFGGWHGTPVNAIVGAVGNNNLGVAGVNWQVKLMNIVGGADNQLNEALIIEAYDYALSNKLLYRETEGQKGAYVVVTNSSWGVDYGQPADAPIWCAMYDTLGKYGILSAGATINEGVNVDVVGDLPTACNSPYLISVTNTTRFDTKAGNAGFGATTIDIGAPGSNVFTAFSTNQYGNFGGTSGATPHVAGTVALMHSLKCNVFAQDVFLYPDSMALRIKNYILSQSDLIAALENITVSGARLNVNNALRKLASDYNCLPVGIENNSKSALFNVYPNPSQNLLYIQAESEINNCVVYDLAGKILLEKDNYNAKLITLDVNSFPFGTYIIEIKDFENQVSRKIFVKN